MTATSKWIRVTKAQPCPICEHGDWCTRAADGTVACCMRTESQKTMKNGGWLHRLSDPLPAVKTKRRPDPVVPAAEFGHLADRYAKAVGDDRIRLFAKSLGVSALSLRRLNVGSDSEGAWTFPMRDAQKRVTGIRRRLQDGRKLSVKGGHEGLFYDPNAIGGRDWILLPEGPTDTAALMTLGFVAVGRPSCLGGREIVKQLVGNRDCVVVSDADEPGRRGARQLASELEMVGRVVKVIQPPSEKDIRAYVQKRIGEIGPGRLRLVVESLIKNACVV